jgi:hypothetical protein
MAGLTQSAIKPSAKRCLIFFVRIFAHSAFACGSMVLGLYCGSFLPPEGQKMTQKGLNPTDKRKSYLYFVFALAEGKNEI